MGAASLGNGLIEDGEFHVEIILGVARQARHNRVMKFTQSHLYHACVDIGGTKVAISLVDAHAATINQHTPLLAKRTEPTVKTGAHDALPTQIIRMIDSAAHDMGVDLAHIASVGVSSCGPFVKTNGQIELVASNICGGQSGFADNDWVQIPLEQCLRGKFQQLRIENDAVAALVAELRWGHLQGSKNAAYVTWSTGIGMGLCVDGQVLRGKNGNAGHGGHMFVSTAADGASALQCGCGNMGDLQAHIAGGSMMRRYGLSAAELMNLARQGDQLSLARVDAMCDDMGKAIYNLTTLLDLECVALGGSVFWWNQDLLLPRIQAVVGAKFPAMTQGLRIMPAGLGASVGDFAALALCDLQPYQT
jgi:glucokinase